MGMGATVKEELSEDKSKSCFRVAFWP